MVKWIMNGDDQYLTEGQIEFWVPGKLKGQWNLCALVQSRRAPLNGFEMILLSGWSELGQWLRQNKCT